MPSIRLKIALLSQALILALLSCPAYFFSPDRRRCAILATMKIALIACGAFLVGAALLAGVSDADFVPGGVRQIFDDVASIW